MNKIKVVFYLNMYLKGGVEKSLNTYLNALDKDKFDVTLIIANYMGDYELSKQDIPSHIKIVYLIKSLFLNKFIQKKINHQLSFIDRFFENIFLKSIRVLIYNFKIRVLLDYPIVIDYGLNLLNKSYKLCSKAKIIGFFHFNLMHYNNPKKKILEKRLVNYSKLICITESMYEQAVKQFSLTKDKFCLLYNQINFDDLYLKSKDFSNFEDILNQNSLIKSGNYIISIARLEDQYKDFPTLIRAYAKCFHYFNIKMPLVIIGDGLIKSKLEDLSKTLNVDHMIYFLGFQDNPYVFLKHAKMCILSSKSEGFSLVLAEAMILQVPVISTNCPVGPRELLLDGRCGLLCEVSDINDMANAINILCQNSRRCEDLICNANKYLNRFDIRYNINILSQLIEIVYFAKSL